MNRRRARAWLLPLVLLLGWDGAAAQESAGAAAGEQRVERVRTEIARLRAELRRLESRERSVLGELEQVGARLRLQQAELEEVGLRLEQAESGARQATERIARLGESHAETRRYLEFRLRELYKRGPGQALRRLVGGSAVDSWLRALRYASWLSKRDARALGAFREERRALRAQQELLAVEVERLGALRDEAASSRARLLETRNRQARILTGIRRDSATRRAALEELEAAARGLTGLVQEPGTPAPSLDVRKFRGLLDPPAEGEVSAGFGRVVHPRFRTEVPHPGIDIDAPAGADFRAVFDGAVLFASWLRGYGLTAIVDHGDGVVSVYAHASVLLVEKGDRVRRGDVLGKVGETGSLRGPYLYFEIRDGGKPVDPAPWLRRP